MLPALCELGEAALAYRLFTSREYPSWCYPVVNGATTVWERWNSYSKETGFGDVSMNSFNHYAYGSVGEWMFKYCLGIQPSAEAGEGGFARLMLRPFFDQSGAITHAEGHYVSVRGRISVRWARERDGSYRFDHSVPEGVNVSFDFKDMEVRSHKNGTFVLQPKNACALHTVSNEKREEKQDERVQV